MGLRGHISAPEIPGRGRLKDSVTAQATVMDDAGKDDYKANDDDDNGVADDVARRRRESKSTRKEKKG